MKARMIQRYASVAAFFLFLGLAPVSVSAAEQEKEKTTTSAEEISQETQQLLTSLKDYSIEQKDEAMKATKDGLDTLDAHIEELQAKIDKDWDNMDQAAREKARNSLKLMQEQRVKLAEWYGSMKSSSAGAWEHVKEGFSGAYDSLSEAWQKASEEFSDEEEKE
ncbi:hypothetical protein L4174_017470 [Photobacterium sp. CCB-ST2H9]|uniref:hypothetical protein n=1 Tax=Photobacterium sp. CCB-ST2H9 TaxID=2912855 RepID=UPI00200331D9|nr:hypothetical protein [Photobacterium sp. CCB-ST2H9]UTM59862.1 hypothetical protein L4174_017470 [Photobacterium sp. CCB-ST2H9]